MKGSIQAAFGICILSLILGSSCSQGLDSGRNYSGRADSEANNPAGQGSSEAGVNIASDDPEGRGYRVYRGGIRAGFRTSTELVVAVTGTAALQLRHLLGAQKGGITSGRELQCSPAALTGGQPECQFAFSRGSRDAIPYFDSVPESDHHGNVGLRWLDDSHVELSMNGHRKRNLRQGTVDTVTAAAMLEGFGRDASEGLGDQILHYRRFKSGYFLYQYDNSEFQCRVIRPGSDTPGYEPVRCVTVIDVSGNLSAPVWE